MFKNNKKKNIQFLFSSFTPRYQHDYSKNPKLKSKIDKP